MMIKRIDGAYVDRVHVCDMSCFSHNRPINVEYLLHLPVKLKMKEGIIVIGTF